MNQFKQWTAPPIDKSTKDIQINRIGIFHSIEKGQIDRKKCKDIFILYALSPMMISDQFGSQSCPANSFICWKRHQDHFYGQAAKPWKCHWLHIDGPRAEALTDHFPCNQVIEASRPDRVHHFFLELFDEVSQFKIPDQVILKNLLENLLRHLKRSVSISDKQTTIPEAYLQIKSFIETNYMNPLNLADLAQRIQKSPAHFNKMFKHFYSITPINYLIKVRMEQAAYLLQDHNLKISTIAEMVGYQNVYFFSKFVKQFYGLSPKKLRESMRENNTNFNSLANILDKDIS